MKVTRLTVNLDAATRVAFALTDLIGLAIAALLLSVAPPPVGLTFAVVYGLSVAHMWENEADSAWRRLAEDLASGRSRIDLRAGRR